jgi:hypothetical protein
MASARTALFKRESGGSAYERTKVADEKYHRARDLRKLGIDKWVLGSTYARMPSAPKAPPTEQRKEGKFKRRDCVLDWPVVGGLKPVPRFVPHFVGGDRTWSCEEGDPRSASMMLSADHRKKGVTDEEVLRRSKKAAQSAREKPFSVQDAVRPAARVRSLCRFGNRGTEYLRKSGINWMIGCAKRKCDRTLPAARGAPQ